MCDCLQVHKYFEEIGTIDCAHLRVVTQGQMCTLTAYDANKHIMPMCFAVFPSETAENWEMFTTHMFTLFPGFRCIVSDGSKGLEAVHHVFLHHGVPPFPLPNSLHIHPKSYCQTPSPIDQGSSMLAVHGIYCTRTLTNTSKSTWYGPPFLLFGWTRGWSGS